MLRLFVHETAARVARRVLLGLALVAAGTAWAQQPAFTPRDETPEEFAAGAGRDETFYSCTACHNFKLVAQQGMSRRQWDETLTVMTQRHGMPPLDDKDREAVLNYLESAYPPRTPAGRGWQNPFLNR
jgi:mono/diheme cytochrome c family protein